MSLLDYIGEQWKQWQRHPQVVQGMTLRTLMEILARNDFQVDSSCLGRLAYLVVLGVLNSIYGACETIFNSREIEACQPDPAPLFIVGHWRSGTTHLHNLLSLDDNFASPTAYQALFPNHFIFTQVAGRLFDLLAPKKRPMDNVVFGSSVPHEDEFALAAQSTVSPYMKVLFPLTERRIYWDLDPGDLAPQALDKWERSLILFLKKLAISEGGRPLLKSPPHMGRVATLLRMFPQAKFVHIVRNPYAVYMSTRKLWQDSFAFAHLQIPVADEVDGMILSWYKKLFYLFERDRKLLGQGSLHEMKYEDLESKPLETLAALYDRLDLPEFDRFREMVSHYLDTIQGYRKNTYFMDDSGREKVERNWRGTFGRYGYQIDSQTNELSYE